MSSHSTLSQQRYGKSQVRLSRIDRTALQHEFVEWTVDISLEGDFAAAYVEGNNRSVIPTDTMKNTVYALAATHGVASCEAFAITLANHFVQKFSHVDSATVSIREHLWRRLEFEGNKHPHAFLGGQNEQNTCLAEVTSAGTVLQSGFEGLQVLKTTQSGFSSFLSDDYTTLAETEDRIFATTITATWPAKGLDQDWAAHRRSIRAAILDVFANRFSPSVQKTLFEMAESALAVCTAIGEISIAMPNQHHLLANLAPFGLSNDNEVFVPTAEPFGMISATIQRERGSS